MGNDRRQYKYYAPTNLQTGSLHRCVNIATALKTPEQLPPMCLVSIVCTRLLVILHSSAARHAGDCAK